MVSKVLRILPCGVAMMALSQGATAQTTTSPTPDKATPATVVAPAVPATAPVAPSKPFACERPNSPQQRDAVVAAEALFDASWLRDERAGRVTAFKTKPEVINPFAIRDPKAEPPKPPITGYIRADQTRCEGKEIEGEIVVAMFGRHVRFHEAGKWSGAIKRGLLMVVGVKVVDGAAKAETKADAPTVVLPDASLRKPEASEVPPLGKSKPQAKAKSN